MGSGSQKQIQRFAVQLRVVGRTKEGPAQFKLELGIHQRDLQHVRESLRLRFWIGCQRPRQLFQDPIRRTLEKNEPPNAQTLSQIPVASHERDHGHHSQPECRERRNGPNRTEPNEVHNYQDKARDDQKVEGIFDPKTSAAFMHGPYRSHSATKNLVITDEVRDPARASQLLVR